MIKNILRIDTYKLGRIYNLRTETTAIAPRGSVDIITPSPFGEGWGEALPYWGCEDLNAPAYAFPNIPYIHICI